MFQGAPGRLPGAGGMGLYHSFIYKELDDTVLSPLLCLTGGLSLKDFHVYGEDRPIITDKTVSRTLPPWQAGGGGREGRVLRSGAFSEEVGRSQAGVPGAVRKHSRLRAELIHRPPGNQAQDQVWKLQEVQHGWSLVSGAESDHGGLCDRLRSSIFLLGTTGKGRKGMT